MDVKRREKLEYVQSKIGYTFDDITFLDIALTHTSYVKGEGRRLTHNERMEFLGDAVLEFCVSEFLYENFPEMDEGTMTRIRAYTVCESALYEVSKMFGIGEALLLSHGEEHSGGRRKPSICSDATEAVIGAIFLDGGIKNAKSFVLSFATEFVYKAVKMASTKDYKTLLQEKIQSTHAGTLHYELRGEKGPDHKKTFMMDVLLNNDVVGSGEGGSKQEAGQQAAKAALEFINRGVNKGEINKA